MTPIAVIWTLAMAVGLASTMLAAASNAHDLHFVMSLLLGGFIAIMAIRERRIDTATGAPQRTLAAQAMRYMGFIWSWAAASILLVYGTLIEWPTWVAVTSILIVFAGICLFMASVLDRDQSSKATDDRPLRFADFIVRAKLAVACSLFGCLLAAGQLSGQMFGGEAKWVAVNVLLSTTLCQAVLCAFVIATTKAGNAMPLGVVVAR